MKNLVLFSLSLISISAFAQPVIEGTYLPVRNTSVLQVWDTAFANNLIAPNPGTNQTWDYSSLFGSSLDTFAVKALDVDDTPYGTNFPNSNLATYWNVPFQLQDSLYTYFIIDTAGLHKLGGWSEKTEIDTIFKSIPTETVMPFSVSYQMTPINNSYLNVGYGKATYLSQVFRARYAENRNKVFNGIGYGTLTTPIGTFNDVVVLEEHVTGTDTVWVDLDGNSNTGHEGYEFKYLETPVNHKYFHFVRNNTFASTHLMLLKYDVVNTKVQYGWYTLPVDFGSIEGDVFDSTGAPVTIGEMYLYREHSNFTKNDILAKANLDNNGHYRFDSIPYGEYRIACRPDLFTYPGALTTYIGDSTDWVSCPTVITSNDITGIDINLRYLNGNSGNATVNGNLSLDYAYGKNNWGNPNILGEPVQGVNISIGQEPGGVIYEGQQDESELNGNFTLPNIAPGDYTIWVDIPGMYMAGSYDITITGSETIVDIDFVVGEDSIWPADWPARIEERISNNQLMSAFPNPNNGIVTIEVDNLKNGEYSIQVLSLVGQIVQTNNFEITNSVNKDFRRQIDISNLSNGTYFITLNKAEEQLSSLRIIKN